MVDLDSMDIMAIISDATNLIAEGEVMQLASIGRTSMTEDEYLEVVRRKTAMLFQAAAHTGAVLCSDDPDLIDAMRRYGLHFGMAYQLVDDWLDYAGDSDIMGKNRGDDLAEGKVTLPLIHTMANGHGNQSSVVRRAIDARSAVDFHNVAHAVHRSGGLGYTKGPGARKGLSRYRGSTRAAAEPLSRRPGSTGDGGGFADGLTAAAVWRSLVLVFGQITTRSNH